MNKEEQRNYLMTLLAIHDSNIVCFRDCEGCELCDEIKAVGRKMHGRTKKVYKAENSKEIKTIRNVLYKIFDEYGSNLTYRESSKLITIEFSQPYYYNIRRQYRKEKKASEQVRTISVA